MACIDQNNVPTIVPPKGCSKETVLEMIHAKSLMIQHFMSKEKQQQKHLHSNSFLCYFLNEFKKFDDAMNEAKLPSYITHYNFLSLLNLSKQVEYIGSLRNVWEGGEQGEGFIQKIKTELRPGLIKKWEKWSIDNILIDSSIDNIHYSLSKKNNNRQHIFDEFKVYQNEILARNAINSGRPISGFSTINNLGIEEHYIAYRNDGSIYLLQVEKNQAILFNNLYYYELTYKTDDSNTPISILLDNIKEQKNIVGVLYLPKLEEKGYPKRTVTIMDTFYYTLIKSDWSRN